MKYNPSLIKEITLDGKSLVFEEFIAAARFGAKVKIDPEALERMQKSRELAEKIQNEGRAAYGITTGFGQFQNTAVAPEMSNQLSTNLILSHCTGVGEPYKDEVVRGIMILRCNNLLVGISGVRPLLVEIMVDMLNKGVTPVVPQKGSLGSSGDLAPLAHMTLPILGLGEARYNGEVLPGAEAMKRAGVQTVDTLVCKEGLGMTNGTCAMTSCGALACYDAICAVEMADVIASMTMEALTCQRNAFDPRVHECRGHRGQIKVADNLKMLTEGSPLLDKAQGDRVQDAYALRCVPQIHGAVRDSLQFVIDKVTIELNAVTDNPLLFLEDEAVISGGNFHGEPMALPFDLLGIAAAEIANVSERRIERMVNAALSNGLTPFLVTEPGLNSGFMIVQYAAASIVSESKIYAHPASVDSIPSSANQEDIVSMGTTAARTAAMIVDNTLDVLALELLTACQAIDIRRRVNTHGQEISPFHQVVYDKVREEVDFYEIDREIWPDIRAMEGFIRRKDLLDIIDIYMPELLENNAWGRHRKDMKFTPQVKPKDGSII